MILPSIYALIASLGFGIIFNIRGRNLLIASIGGGLSWLTYLIALQIYGSDVFAFFVSATIVSIYSEIMARIFKAPVTIFVICSIIPLVPGGGMYYATSLAVKGDYTACISKGMSTLLNAGAIAIAIVFVSTISKIIKKLKANNPFVIKK